MVECQFSVLLQINFKVENIMRCLDIPPHLKREVIQEPQIFQVIIGNLSKILDGLLLRDHREELIHEQAGKMYENMERQLQRQQNLNRCLIKKELESKQYQNCLFDQLAEERKTVKELQSQLNKTSDKMLAKDFEILQLNNEKKTMFKDTTKDKKSKQLFMFETLINDKKLIDPLKYLTKQATITTHRRRNSDEVTKRPSTAQVKKKSSIPKK